MSDKSQAFDAYLNDHLDGYIEDVKRLVAQPSISAEEVGQPECAAIVADMLKARGYEVYIKQTSRKPAVIARLKGASERTLLFYNHYDVQPVEPLDLWTTPPFEPEVRDGSIYGRGSKDDKGEFVARMAAVDAVREAYGGTLPCSVTFLVEGEEEIGSPNIVEIVQDNLDLLGCHGSIWEEGGIDEDGHPLNILGVRGILYVQFKVTTMSRDAHSGGAHALPNAAWRLLRVLASLKGEDERVLIPGFYEDVQGPTSADEAAFEALGDYEQSYRETYGVTEFVRGATGKDLERNVFEPTCNIAGIWSGYQGSGMKTVIPAEAGAKVDFRLVMNQDPDDIFEKLRAHLDAQGFADVEVEKGGMMWPARTPPDDPLVELTARTGEEVYGIPSLIYPTTGGSSPIYAVQNALGVPVVRAGVGYWDNRAHAPDEHMRIEDFLKAMRHIARILDEFGDL